MNLLLSLFLAASTAPEPVSVAAAELRGVNLTREEAAFFSDHLAQALGEHGLRVVTQAEMAAVIGLDRQKQLLGCEEESSCLQELAGALGTDGIITGSVARLDTRLQVNVRIVAAQNAAVLASFSGSATSKAGMLDTLSAASPKLARQVITAMGRSSPEGLASSGGFALRPAVWIPAAAGVAVGGVGAAFFASGKARGAALISDDPDLRFASPGDARTYASAAERDQVVGVIGMALGAGGVVAATVIALMPQSPVGIAVVPVAHGFVIGGVLP